MLTCHLDSIGGHLILRNETDSVALPPLWLRERSQAEDQMDLASHQRYYDPTRLPRDLGIAAVREGARDVDIAFTDGHRHTFDLRALAVDAGLAEDPYALPTPRPWTTETLTPVHAGWDDLDDDAIFLQVLNGFYRDGFCVLRGTPTEQDSLLTIARRFGPIRETNWGALFNVRTEPNASDLAYTGRPLTAHTDNPYRRSVPGIQFLHCLVNDASGGASTVVDGMAIAARLEADAPDVFSVMSTLPVSFRYESDSVIDRFTAPVLGLDSTGALRHIRLSTRLDFPPAADPETLELFFEGRRRLAALAADPLFEHRFTMEPGDCLVMDNHRTLHGRTEFRADGGRFLQGCYIDHDGPENRYRLLRRRLATQPNRQEAAA